MSGRVLVIGFRRWRQWNLGPIIAAWAAPRAMRFVRDVAAAAGFAPGPEDALLVWGAASPAGLDGLAARSGARVVRIEDGFVRSVGLGSDLIVPRSLAFDDCGIYFDATRPSALEQMLQAGVVSADVEARAAALRRFVVERGLTKYNVDQLDPPQWANRGRPVVLVPGQVESDASIALGGADIRTNQALIAAARAARPDAIVVYKPHPDVVARNRAGAVLAAGADHVETCASIIACIGAVDEVHTITSLAGFDALLRGRRVVTYGAPFYAGWGLTEDRATGHPAFARRTRRLTLDQLVAGAMVLCPTYWDPAAQRITTPEAALAAIASEREQASPSRLNPGFWPRQARKAGVLARAWSQPMVHRGHSA